MEKEAHRLRTCGGYHQSTTDVDDKETRAYHPDLMIRKMSTVAHVIPGEQPKPPRKSP